MGKEYLNEDDLIRRGDVIAAIGNTDRTTTVEGRSGDAFGVKCQFITAVLSIPPASENATDRIEIVMEFATAKKKMELAEKYLELDKKVARLDDSIRQIGNDEKTKTGSMVITCDCVMPFVDIDVDDVKSMLRTYRDNLRIKMDTLWKEFSTIDLGKEEK